MATKRIIELDTGAAVSGDYVMTDSATTGTKKVELVGASGGMLPVASTNAPDHVHPSDTGKVDKVDGKGLSTEDYTTAEKSKLAGIEAGAEVNVIESVTVNGASATVSGKAASVTLPEATDSASGLMSATDKGALDAIAADGGVGTSSIADFAVTTPKLADQSVTDAKLSTTGVLAKANRLFGNVLRGTATGAVTQAHGTYAAPPLDLTVNGMSVQDGTPTPSDPVDIESVDSVTICAAGRNLLVGTDVSGSNNSVTRSYTASTGVLAMSGTASANNTDIDIVLASGLLVPDGESLTVTLVDGTRSKSAALYVYARNAAGTYVQYKTMDAGAWSVTLDEVGGEELVTFKVRANTGNVLGISSRVMVTLGSDVPTEYVAGSYAATAIGLQGHSLRSLPDGTHDELAVDADGNVTLVQRVGYVADAGGIVASQAAGGNAGYYAICSVTQPLDNTKKENILCTGYKARATADHGNCYFVNSSTSVVFANSGFTSKSTAKELLTGIEFIYPLATPVTILLGTVTLPSLPAPEATAWVDMSPQTTMTLDYERDLTMAITAIESAIADMA